MKDTLLIAVAVWLAGVLMTFPLVTAAQQPTAVVQPEQVPATIPAGNREVVERFARSQVNFIALRLMMNGEEIDPGLWPDGKRELSQPSSLDDEVKVGMDQILRIYLSKARRAGLTVGSGDEYHFILNFEARYQAGTGVLDPKGSVIGTALRDIKSTPFHLQKVGDAWAIPPEGYQFTLDWFRNDYEVTVMVGIPVVGIRAMDLCLADDDRGVRRYREDQWMIQDGLILVCAKQLACEINMREGTRAWLTLWFDETSGVRVNYDLRTGMQIPWGHDKVPKLSLRKGQYPSTVFLDLSNLELGSVYTVVSASSVDAPATNVIGTVRVDESTGMPVSWVVHSGGDHGFFTVRPATPDESWGAKLASARVVLKGN
jgi:hypothetical protein